MGFLGGFIVGTIVTAALIATGVYLYVTEERPR